MTKKTFLISALAAFVLGGASIASAHNDHLHVAIHAVAQEVKSGAITIDEAVAKVTPELKKEIQEHCSN